jgi:hypothetical protein
MKCPCFLFNEFGHLPAYGVRLPPITVRVVEMWFGYFYFSLHMRTTTVKNMGMLKYHQTSLIVISYERGWPLAFLDDLIKPNQASHQGAR